MQIGVFDSGIGGKVVARQLQVYFANAEIRVIDDSAHLPYGSRSHDEIRRLTDTAIQPLLGSDAIVIACNTATTAAIDWLRKKYPSQLFIGIEPMIKTASQHTASRVVCVCATPATLGSEHYRQLKRTYGSTVRFIEPDCSEWARLIEKNQQNTDFITSAIKPALDAGADVVVLGCTHYHWIKRQIEEMVGETVSVLEPTDAIARRLESLLATKHPLPR